MRALLLHALVAALLAAAGIAAYDRWVLRPTLVVGVVDLSEVYRAKEAEFTQMLTSTGTEAERDAAIPNPSMGDEWFNTDLAGGGKWEKHTGTDWKRS